MSESTLSPNMLAFIGLSNEYCHALEHAAEAERDEFIDLMLKLLPRLYISATDLPVNDLGVGYIPDSLDEESYDSIRRSLEGVFGEDDMFLDASSADMKYSEVPIPTSISEQLADIFQVLYNLLESVKDAPNDLIIEQLQAVRDDFTSYWSNPLCQALRAINVIKYQL